MNFLKKVTLALKPVAWHLQNSCV